MPKTATTSAGPHLGDFHRLVRRGHTRAGRAARLDGVDPLGDATTKRPCARVLGEAAVDAVAGVPLRLGTASPSRRCSVARAARIAEPWNGRRGRRRRRSSTSAAGGRDDAHALVPGGKGGEGLDGQSPARGVDVRMTQAGCLDVDEDLPSCQARHRHRLDRERRAERVNDRGAVGVGGGVGEARLENGQGHVGCLGGVRRQAAARARAPAGRGRRAGWSSPTRCRTRRSP